MRYISIDSAQPGMIVGKSIYNEQGSILVNYRVKLTERLISRMRDIGLAGLYIEDEMSSDITVEDLISDELGVKATKALTKLDIDAALKVASDITEELSLNGDINVNLISMRTNSDYTYKHSVNVAVLSVLTGIGIGLKKHSETVAKRLSVKYGKLWVAAEVFLFVLVGATVDISYLGKVGFKALILIVIALMFRMLGVFISLLGTRLRNKERLFAMMAYTPKATVQAAIGGIPLALGLSCGDTVLTVAVLAIVLTAPIGAFAIDLSYKKLLSK